MSKFENKIRQHKRSFDHREPDKDHLARFILKLEADEEKQQHRRSPWLYLRIAASLVILLTTAYLAFNYFSNGPQEVPGQVQLISYSPELEQALAYYDQVSEAKMLRIDDLVEDEEEAEKLKKTASSSLQDLDIRLASIEKEYMKNPESEELKAALINNKRKKVEVMERIIMQIDFANARLY